MIRRRTVTVLAKVYSDFFVFSEKVSASIGDRPMYAVKNSLYDFLYDNEYDRSFMNLIRREMISYHEKNKLREFILGMHSGESIGSITREMSEESRREQGQ